MTRERFVKLLMSKGIERNNGVKVKWEDGK